MVCVAGILALGIVYAPFNYGSANFFIYAASMAPFALETEWSAALVIAGIVVLAALESWWLHIPRGFLFPATFLSTFIGAANIYFAQRHRHIEDLRRAHDEIEHLAKIAERERIARDLHDVLGHTLSLITLKSELAGKLIDRDPVQARKRDRRRRADGAPALADVRAGDWGLPLQGTGGRDQARSGHAGDRGCARGSAIAASIELPATQESVLALVLREAVTNVVRHARARHCRVEVQRVEWSLPASNFR